LIYISPQEKADRERLKASLTGTKRLCLLDEERQGLAQYVNDELKRCGEVTTEGVERYMQSAWGVAMSYHYIRKNLRELGLVVGKPRWVRANKKPERGS